MRLESSHEYDDMIDLPHHVSSRHPQMPLADRAAQFSPFAALTGHEAAIQETARLTEDFIELDEERQRQLNEQFQLLKKNQSGQPEIEVTYFQPDLRKSGGAYVTVRGRVKRIDEYGQQIIFTDKVEVPMKHIFSIEGEMFDDQL